MVKSTELEGLFLSVYVDDIKNGRKKAESPSYVEEVDEIG